MRYLLDDLTLIRSDDPIQVDVDRAVELVGMVFLTSKGNSSHSSYGLNPEVELGKLIRVITATAGAVAQKQGDSPRQMGMGSVSLRGSKECPWMLLCPFLSGRTKESVARGMRERRVRQKWRS